MEARSFREQVEISSAMASIRGIVDSGSFDSQNPHVFGAAVTYGLIHLTDLLKKADKEGRRVDFAQDVTWTSREPKDVTTLIVDARNAACHAFSKLPDIAAGRLRMAVVRGYAPRAILIAEDAYGCEYADDVAVIYGPIKVYIRRHFLRAFDDVKRTFA